MKKTLFILASIGLILSFFTRANAQSRLWGSSYSISTSNNVDGHLYHTNGDGNFFTVAHNFNPFPGANPSGTRLLDIGDGLLYGMTQKGGADDVGIIFSYNPSSQDYITLHEFNIISGGRLPQGSLIQASNGLLYGTTSAGGTFGVGTVFQFDLSTKTLTTLINFNGASLGASPFGDLLEANDGLLYGMTSQGGSSSGGTLFSLNTTTNTPAVLHYFGNSTFDGMHPYGNLIQASNNNLYGMTSAGGGLGVGTIFEYNISSTAYSIRQFFSGGVGNTQGSYPYGSLVETSNNILYGLTYRGGVAPNDDGVVFKLDANTNTYTRLQDLNAAASPSSLGGRPNGSLMLASNGKLYGLCELGGLLGQGSLIEFTPGASVVKKLDFTGVNTGSTPVGTMMQANNGKLYGMTISGGASGFGVLFDYSAGSTSLNQLLNFSPTINGYNPTGDLVYVNSLLFGVCQRGGANGGGVIYSYDAVNKTYTKRVDFSSTTGLLPNGLFLASNGLIYGTTQAGGSSNLGTLFSFNPNSSSLLPVHSFAGGAIDGAYGVGSVAELNNGMLYGVCSSGGVNAGITGTANDAGVIFEYNTNNGAYGVKYNFGGGVGTGISAAGGLIANPINNTLFGTNYGGGLGRGMVFEFDPNPIIPVFNILTNFPGAGNVPSYPSGELLLANDGMLYGHSTTGGASAGGTLFQVNPMNGNFGVVQDFGLNPINYGATPQIGLMQATNNKLYGTTVVGAATANGALYEYDPNTTSISSKKAFDRLQGSSELYELPCQAKTGMITPNICGLSYTSPMGNTYFQSGMYSEILQGSNGCDSILNINLSLTLIDTTVDAQDSALFALSPTASVQWLDCNNSFTTISGETNQLFMPSSSGFYAAQLTENNCVDTSACYSISIPVGLTEQNESLINIFPNPSAGSFHLKGINMEEVLDLQLYNWIGQTIPTKFNKQNRLVSTQAHSGNYILLITTKNKVHSLKVLIE